MALPSPLQNIAPHLRWIYPVTVIVTASTLGNIFGLGLGLLTVAGGVLGASIWLFWSSLQGLGSDVPLTLDEALSLGAPSAEEEQKRSVLRALKDLEYERTVGKINEDDYAHLAQHYREEAKRLLRAVDKDLGPERERAERILAERLAAAPNKTSTKTAVAAAVDSAPTSAPSASSDDVSDDAAAEPPLAKRPSSDTAP
jgi:hypothetical protein